MIFDLTDFCFVELFILADSVCMKDSSMDNLYNCCVLTLVKSAMTQFISCIIYVKEISRSFFCEYT